MFKFIHLIGEEFGLQIDRNVDMDIFVLRLNDFIEDEENSAPGKKVFKENRILEVYPTVDEIKQIIKALKEILPEDEADE
jgi:uncharacterized protein YwqG